MITQTEEMTESELVELYETILAGEGLFPVEYVEDEKDPVRWGLCPQKVKKEKDKHQAK